jgi:hypothetical protein
MQSKGNEISKNKISGCKSGKIGIAKDSSNAIKPVVRSFVR